MKKSLSLVIALSGMSISANAQLVINEVMQSNIDCLVDDINEFPDSWVELYNTGSSAENLNTYKIGLTSDISKAYSLPSRSVASKGYAIIYCDKANTGLHTDFRLESGKGGCIYLFKNGVVVDKIENMKKQPAPNIAYGRKESGSDTWGYMATPTPHASNCGKVCKDILGEPVFSVPGRILESKENISLTLTLPEGSPEGTVIRYTTDGTEPTTQSTQYTSPITIASTKVIRAKLFCTGYLSPRSTTASYIFHNRKMTLPVISIVSNDKYFYDSRLGIIVDGSYSSSQKNYEYDWRRPINLEYFTKAGSKSKLNQLCETRVMGGATRTAALKSLAIYANKRFGEKRFKYEFFPDQRPGINDYKSLALRNAGNDFDYLYMRDAVIQRSVAQHADLDWQAWSPAIIYINGVYKGILNIRERSNEDNIYTNYDGLEDIDMFENNYELKAGDWDNFNKFKEFYAEHGHTMAEYEKWMDCKEYINLMFMNLFYNNQDFPGNNIVTWRPKADGGRWRWIAKDTDFGLGLYGSSADYKTFEWLYNPNYDAGRAWANQYEHTRLFRRLMEDADFQHEFIDRAAIYMGDFLTEKNVRKLWDGMYDQVKEEYPIHRKLFNQWWPNYNEELTNARKWLTNRIPSFYQQIADFYKVGTPMPLTINASMSQDDQNLISIDFNGVTLSEPTFDGKFFEGRKFTLVGNAKGTEKEVTGWNVITYNGSSTNKQYISGKTCELIMPKCTKMEISAEIGNATGINVINEDENRTWSWNLSDNTLQIHQAPVGIPIYLYSLQGSMIYQAKAKTSDLSIPLSQNTVILKIGKDAVKIMK